MHFQKHILKTVYTILILFELEKYDKICFSNAKTNFDVFFIILIFECLPTYDKTVTAVTAGGLYKLNSFTTALRACIDRPSFIILKVLTFK